MQPLRSNIAMFLKMMEYYGTEEIPGKEHNPLIISFAGSVIQTWVHTDETGWCSTLMNHVAFECRCARSYQATAKSWLSIGSRVINPELGHLVVFWRDDIKSWKGHCGLFAGRSPRGDIYSLGGNQDNKVNIKLYDKKYLLAYIELPFLAQLLK